MSKTNRPHTSSFRKLIETMLGIMVIALAIILVGLVFSGQLDKTPFFNPNEKDNQSQANSFPQPTPRLTLTPGQDPTPATCPTEPFNPAQAITSGLASPFGLNVHANSRYARLGSLQIPLESARNSGAQWDREEIRWQLLRSSNSQSFDFNLLDETVNKARQRGINILGLLLYKVNNSVPDLATWNQFLASTVSHFKGRIACWQVLNEPENNLYFAGANPVEYARILKASYQTIKNLDPQAKVLTAGVNGFAVPWLQQMLDAGGKDYYDILAVHPYVSFPTSPEAKYWADNQLAYFMAFNQRNGNKPVWATEFGWPTANNPAAVSESDQANYLTRLYVAGLARGLSKMFVYQFHDQGPSSDDNFGLVGSDWITPKPSYLAYKNLVERLNGATFQAKLDPLSKDEQGLADFETDGALGWKTYSAGATSLNLTLTEEQAHRGKKALKLDYGLNGTGYLELGPPTPVALQGQPTRLGFWVYGDDSGATFRVLVQGSDGQLFVYEPGKAGVKGWHRLETFLPGEYLNQGQTGGDGVLRYPLQFKSLQLLRQPDPLEQGWNSTLYLDDFYGGGGANVQLYRFEKAGQTIDVVWAEGGTQLLELPTLSSLDEVKSYNREGNPVAFKLNNQILSFEVGQEMLFFEHKAPP